MPNPDCGDIIAMLSLVLSVAIWVKTLWEGRMQLKVEIDFNSRRLSMKYDPSTHLQEMTLPLRFSSKSSNAVAITDIQIFYKNSESASLNVMFDQKVIGEYQFDGQHIKTTELVKSARFPIHILPNGARYEYCCFGGYFSEANSISHILVHTNHRNVTVKDDSVIDKLNQRLLADLVPSNPRRS